MKEQVITAGEPEGTKSEMVKIGVDTIRFVFTWDRDTDQIDTIENTIVEEEDVEDDDDTIRHYSDRRIICKYTMSQN